MCDYFLIGCVLCEFVTTMRPFSRRGALVGRAWCRRSLGKDADSDQALLLKIL